MTNKIGWCDMTWNPVWGCRNHCEYCYARRIAKRFAGVIAEKEIDEIYGGSIDSNSLIAFYDEKKEDIKNFKPTFLHSQFNKKFPKKPQRIFVGSMSEIYYWDEVWVEKVIEKIKQYPQHTFQFLTKYPEEVYANWVWPKNCWLGITVTKETDMYKTDWHYLYGNNNYFISFEPLLEEINLHFLNPKIIDWVIIGAETGNRKEKVIPNLDWVLEIVRYCEHHKIPVYIKDNLTKYYAECRGYKQFPKGDIA